MIENIFKIKVLFVVSLFVFFCTNKAELKAQEKTNDLKTRLENQQDKFTNYNDTDLFKKLRLNLSFSGLGISIELPVSNTFALDYEIGLGASYTINQNFNYHFRLDDPSVYAIVFGKYYYNMSDKNISANKHSKENFWGFKAKYASESIIKHRDSNTLFFATNWGIRRHIYNNFYLNLTMGIGSAISLARQSYYRFTLYPDFNLKISYAIRL